MKLKLKPKFGWFLAYTVAFAVFAGFVFWGTWSPDVAPVMPDSWTTHPTNWISRYIAERLGDGKFIPSDILTFLGTPYLFQEFKFALALYLAGLGVAYYARGRGLDRLASYGAGLLLAFCGYWCSLYSAGHYGWFLWMMYGVFAFGLVDRLVRKPTVKHAILLGAVVAWAGFNQQDLWLLFTCFTAAYFVWCCVRERTFPWKGVLIAALTFVLIGAPNFIETINGTLKGRQEQIDRGENVTQKGGDETAKRWEFVTNWSMPPEDTLEWLFPGVHGDTSCPFVLSIGRQLGTGVMPYTGRLGRPMNAPSGNYRQHSLYVGWCILGLALCGLFTLIRPVAGVKRGEVAFFAVAALLFYLFSLGRFFEPAYRVIFALPMGDLIRCPVKWHHLTELCLVVLAAYGLESLSQLKVKHIVLILSGVVLLGVADLARVDHRYCVPVNVSAARQSGLKGDLTILSRRDFQYPQVQEMVKRGQIRSVATYLGNPDVFVVQVLQPFEPMRKPGTPLVQGLGILSFLTTLGVLAYGLKRA